jgi:hypothetical protein
MEYAAKKHKQVKHIFLFTLLLIFIGFTACDDSDDFSSDNGLKLSFSTDTVKFETVLSEIGSPTKQFMIYNRNSKGLRIESIELMNPATSGFRMNIDNEKGTKLSNVEILGKDSLYAFIEITPLPDCPPIIRDSIRFTTNGNVQYIQLEAIGQNVAIWNKKRITADTTLTDDKSFLIYDSLVVEHGVKLEIKENVKFYFHHKASLNIHGTLIAEGTTDKPIIMRGDRFDNISGNIPYDNVSGRWEGITFSKNSYNNKLENVLVKNATKGITFEASDPQTRKATLLNTVVQNTSLYGVQATNCLIDAANCLFANSAGAALNLFGGDYSFTHCTIVNYYEWSSRQYRTMTISNISDDLNQVYPLTRCDIINSIIYGSTKDELMLTEAPNTGFNYLFHNCVIKSEKKTGTSYTGNIWNEDPMFKDMNDNRLYYYDFHLQSQSSAINKADKTYSLSYPFDQDGNPRLNDTNPDIGCYEWISD